MPEANQLSLQLDPEWGAVVVRMVGEFDALCERLFMACVQQLLEEQHPAVVFDLARVQFRDPAAIRCLLKAHQQFRAASRRMALVGIPPAVEEVLRLVGIHHPITIYDGIDDLQIIWDTDTSH